MAEDCTEAASGCVADAPPLAAAAPPGDVEMSDCPAAAAEAGQSARQHRVWTPRDTSETLTIRCSCVCCMRLCRCPLVTAGSAPRKDAAGWPACECCGTRWTRCKGKLYKHGAGKICQRCHNISTGRQAAPTSTTVATTSARSHKRKQPSAPAVTVAQPLSPLPPLPPPSPFHQPLWHSHGWALRASTRSSRGAAASWLELAQSDELKQWERKRGGFYQHNTHPSLVCSFLDEKRVRLLY